MCKANFNKMAKQVNHKIRCELCNKDFTTKYCLKMHIQAIHEKLKPNKCNSCEKSFLTNSQRNRHVKEVHLKIKSYKCNSCEKSFSQNHSLKTHVSSMHEHSIPYVPCDICGKDILKNNLLLHKKRTHEKVMNYHCAFCGKAFYDKKCWLNHQENIHVRTKEEYFACDICEKSFNKILSLKYHMQIHEKNRKKFKCMSCEKSFTNPWILRNHVSAVHNKIKPYKCESCKLAFFQMCRLKRHTDVVHNNLKIFKCEACEESFKFKKTLLRHQAKKHGHNTKSIQCEVCHKNYPDQTALVNHVARVHEMQKIFKCVKYVRKALFIQVF